MFSIKPIVRAALCGLMTASVFTFATACGKKEPAASEEHSGHDHDEHGHEKGHVHEEEK